MTAVTFFHEWNRAFGARWNLRVLAFPFSDSRNRSADFIGETVDCAKPQDAHTSTLYLSPQFLPLPGLAALLTDVAESEAVVIRSSPAGEIVGVLCGPQMGTDFLADERNGFDVNRLPKRTFTLDSTQIFDQAGDPGSLLRLQDDWHLPPRRISHLAAVRVEWTRLNESESRLPLWFIKKSPSPLGALARQMDSENTTTVVSDAPRKWTRSDIDVVAVTTDRYRSVRELLRSVRKVLGNRPGITLVVQAPRSLRWNALAKRFDASFIHVDDDLGLSQSRNVAVSHATRPLVFLMDDDFQLDHRCRVDDALDIMTGNPDIAVLGGNLLDVHHWRDLPSKELSQGFAMKLLTGPPEVTWLRLEDAPRERHFHNATDYVEYCDIVDNFALIRKDQVFDRGVQWNPELKIGAEHQDLYLRLRKEGIGKVARTNTLKVRNVRVQSARFRRLRSRSDVFFTKFFTDWSLISFTILGERTRVRVSDGGYSYLQRPLFNPVYVPPRAGN